MIPSLSLAAVRAAVQPVLAFALPHLPALIAGAVIALCVAVWSPPLSLPALRVPFTAIELWDGRIFDGGYGARLRQARADLAVREEALADITLQLVSVTARLEAEQRATTEAEELARKRKAESVRLAANLDRAETEAARLRRQITTETNEEIADAAPEWNAARVPDAVRAARLRSSCARWAAAGIHHPACGSPAGDDREASG
ncbi:MAG: hypothetical protein ACQRW7_02950 [Caulobacterales bacterium]|uniref:hypothetical protein n=1 Tax=Glycocaulis sp. TaxID=1969725 RepID=UPI003FA0DFF0